jgi:hypothetical protein
MQNIEKTLVKAATILTEVVDKMAKLDTDENSEVLDNCNDTIKCWNNVPNKLICLDNF